MNWDQINPVRHHRYNDLSTVLPRVTTQFHDRSEHNPDFVYLEDQIGLAQQTRDLTELPLNEKTRVALRESQEEKALNIENKRRKAKGEELLTSLDEEELDENGLPVEDAEHGSSLDVENDEEEEEPDVLLTEAGNVLVDVLLLKQQRFAVHDKQKTAE